MALLPLRGRSEDLSRLEQAVGSAEGGHPQLVVVSGPRRVGKTFLLQHLLARVGNAATPVYFEATQAGEADQLRRFADTLHAALGPGELPPGPPFASWEHAIGFCAYVARSRPLVVVLDEATYLMASTPGFTSIVQAVWDALAGTARGPRLWLALAGSAVGLIEDSLAYRGALYQRPALALRLQPFTAKEASEFAGHPDPVALFEAYAACGGYPLHLDSWAFDRPTAENLLKLAGTPGGVLLEDAHLFLASLPESHRRVLIAIGQGRARRSEIANEAGARVDRSLDSLVQARLVRAVTPLGAPQKARPEYRVTDPYLRFWFRVLANHAQRVEAGQGAEVLSHTAGEWQGQLGFVFEQAARQHAVRLVRDGALPAGTLVDEWWATSGDQCQVDVLGLLDHRTVAVGEARWQSRALGTPEIEALHRALRRVPDPVASPHLLLWGRGRVRHDAEVGQVRGFDPLDMLGT